FGSWYGRRAAAIHRAAAPRRETRLPDAQRAADRRRTDPALRRHRFADAIAGARGLPRARRARDGTRLSARRGRFPGGLFEARPRNARDRSDWPDYAGIDAPSLSQSFSANCFARSTMMWPLSSSEMA